MKILNFGSLNIDYVYSVDHFVQKGETISSSQMNIFSGGKGLNQSVALGRAGAKVFHGGRIGKGGEFLVEQLKESGVNTDLVVLDEGCSTGHAIIQNDAEVTIARLALVQGVVSVLASGLAVLGVHAPDEMR